MTEPALFLLQNQKVVAMFEHTLEPETVFLNDTFVRKSIHSQRFVGNVGSSVTEAWSFVGSRSQNTYWIYKSSKEAQYVLFIDWCQKPKTEPMLIG